MILPRHGSPRLTAAWLRAAGIGLLAIVGVACQVQHRRPPETGAATAPQPAVSFVDHSAAAGVDRFGPTYAVAAADYDADGWVDLAVSRHSTVILLANREGRFEDRSAEVGFVPEDTHGVSWIDIDRDGRLDLLVSVGANRGFGQGANQVYRNAGAGRLELVPDQPEVVLDPQGRGRCICGLDGDGDGTDDLLLMNASQADRPNRLAVALADGGYGDLRPRAGVTAIQAECVRQVRLSVDGDPLLLAYGGGAHSGRAFRLGDDGGVEDVTSELGLPTAPQTAYAVVPGDVDNDGDLDLYYVRGHEVPAQIAKGEGYFGFRLIAHARGDMPEVRFRAPGSFEMDLLVGFNSASHRLHFGADRLHPTTMPMTVKPSDPVFDGAPTIDPDRDLGIFLWRESADVYRARVVGDGARVRGVSLLFRGDNDFAVLDAAEQTEEHDRPRPNQLFVYADGRFTDATAAAGVGDPRSGRDAAFFDADNDGDLDLFVVNGGLAFTNQPDTFYLNLGGGRFQDITIRTGTAGPRWGRGCTVTVLDTDRDGRQDLFVTNGDGPPHGNDGRYQLWRNTTDGNLGWAELDLRGSPGTSATSVLIRRGDSRLLLDQGSSNGRFSTSVTPVHVGLGDQHKATVEVHWSTGQAVSVRVQPGDRVTISPPNTSP